MEHNKVPSEKQVRFQPFTRKTPPAEVPASDRRDAHWVTPKITAEVAYEEIRPSGKLRHTV